MNAPPRWTEFGSTGEGIVIASIDTRVGYCWGDNVYGQLGDGTTEDRHLPTQVRLA